MAKSEFTIDCSACKLEAGMEATSIPKFSGFIRFIGFLIAFPSGMVMVFAALIFLQGTFSSSEHSLIGVGLGIVIFATAAVGGLIGWILLQKKNVFCCSRCGFVIDRA